MEQTQLISADLFDPMSDYRKLIGQQIDDYLVNGYIASGGMADVYRATDLSNGQDVALKILYSHYSRNVAVNARFKREADSLILLNHPNIIEVYKSGRVNDQDPYISMEYMPHGSLTHQLTSLRNQGNAMEPGVVLNLLQQIADALTIAHENGIVHRDLKPANILVRPDGTPVLTDLGIAAMHDANTRLTVENQMIGTPDYMSPEQIRAEELDGRSDIYSFGVMMYEMLAGRRPFEAESPMLTLHQHLNVEPPPLTLFASQLPSAVIDIVHRCLQKDQADRYQTMEEVRDAIGAVLRGETPSPPRRNRVMVAIVSLVSLIGLGAAGAFAFSQNRQQEPNAVVPIGVATNAPLLSESPSLESIVADVDIAIPATEASATETIVPETSAAEEISAIDTPVPEQLVVTATSSPTPIPTETRTPVPPTNTPEPTVDEFAGKGNGLPIQFENDDTWLMEGDADGGMLVTDEEAYAGDFSGRLNYDFSAGNTLVVIQENAVPSGNASALTARVWGDASNHELFALIRDTNDQEWIASFGEIDHTGWQLMSAGLSISQLSAVDDDQGQARQPFTFLAIQLEFGGGSSTIGTVYLDSISFQTPATNTPVATATPVATNTPEATPTLSSPSITMRVLEGFRCDEQEHQREMDENIGFKWQASIDDSELADRAGERFVVTVNGAGGSLSLSFTSSFSSNEGEWFVFIEPEKFQVNQSYRWFATYLDANNQQLGQ
ncbi:MAG: protein kinase, partial [Chloroflexota bacterium]